MTNEDRLAEAKRRYPKGTVFNSTDGNKNVIVTDPDKFCMDDADDPAGIKTSAGASQESRCYSAKTNMWATIISTPIPQIINEYEIY